jgi:FolB domain-containing protein
MPWIRHSKDTRDNNGKRHSPQKLSRHDNCCGHKKIGFNNGIAHIMPTNNNDCQADYRIIIKGLRLSCTIGIDMAETGVSQQVLLDVIIIPSTKSNDDVPAVDYAVVAQRLREFSTSKTHGLLETFVNESAAFIMKEFATVEVRIYCRKPHIASDLEEVGVEVIKRR